jgi:WD40 repeat protein
MNLWRSLFCNTARKIGMGLLIVTGLMLAGCGGGGEETSIPATPAVTGVFAVSSPGQVSLSWSPMSGATSYNVYWGTAAGITTASTKIADVPLPYIHTGLTDGNPYYYRISAVSGGVETLSNETFTFLYPGGDPSGSFSASGDMTSARYFQTSTLLPSGKVLIAGGRDDLLSGNTYASAELYDPATGIFTATGSMTTPRFAHTATLLPSGKVLILGGSDGTNALVSAELYDPDTETFSLTAGSMTDARFYSTATLLPNGKVLVSGGLIGSYTVLHSTELYDPATGRFSPAGNMNAGRQSHTATLLSNGKVLVVGGSVYTYAELYNPATGSFSKTGSTIGAATRDHTATLLPDGKVLITGGIELIGNPSPVHHVTAELYEPATGLFNSTGSMSVARFYHTATLLPNGKVLVIGGIDTGPIASAEIYNPATGNFSSTGSMSTARYQHAASLLHDGNVLVTGGLGNIKSSELFY